MRALLAVARTRGSALGADEVVNVVTHGTAFALAVGGAVVLVALTMAGGDAWRVAGVLIYSVCLLFLFAASTAYHSAIGARAKARLRRADHFGIKLLIAGSYTPFLISYGRDAAGLSLLAIVWGFVVLGVVLQAFATQQFYYKASLALYLGMGFSCVPFGGPLTTVLPEGAIALLVIGGLSYTLGVVFYLWERLPFSHGIWHLFVIVGSATHYLAVLRYAT